MMTTFSLNDLVGEGWGPGEDQGGRDQDQGALQADPLQVRHIKYQSTINLKFLNVGECETP